MRFGRFTTACAAAVATLIVTVPAAAIPSVPFVKDFDMGAISGGQREESITVDPTNPDHVAAGANERGIGATQTWYVSTDGGRTFTNGILPNGTLTVPGTTTTLMSDPSLDFGSSGQLYYSALMHGGTGEPCTLFVSETGNNGTNWTDPANGIDRPDGLPGQGDDGRRPGEQRQRLRRLDTPGRCEQPAGRVLA
jgi:hypothetical protein